MPKVAARVAIVTGAGSGIGRAVSAALMAEGWNVALAGRREAELAATAALGEGAPCLVHATDISDESSVDALFAATKARFGRLDLLFNNAGTGAPPTALEDHGLEHWKRVVDVNLTGAFLCTRAAFRLMKDQDPRGGRIINNGSISAHAPRPRSIAYTATKHAITGLTKSLALDGRKYNICAGQVDIGNAATNMTQRMTKGVKQPNGEMMVEPTMDVQNVANAIVYMDSLTLDANVLFMTIKATKMPFEGRG